MPRSANEDEDADYSISAETFSAASHPTTELDTADMLNMAQSGVAQAKPNKVIQLDGGAMLPLEPGWSHSDRDTPSVVIADTLEPSASAQRAAPLVVPVAVAVPVAAPAAVELPAARRGGAWIVGLVYVIAATALALALYERFGR